MSPVDKLALSLRLVSSSADTHRALRRAGSVHTAVRWPQAGEEAAVSQVITHLGEVTALTLGVLIKSLRPGSQEGAA